ncbi:hypothetical protein BEL04_04240 [Mucilaginibacter sp. PPCGB 2223]|uniref:hypothetical protein n=1 Tax=Mucilaginibacter sp. PPCGB 2223 TaxID=1886027 RepID=UPI00082642B4|nr:hypothetical protein [Mucilaginibacter sp. PPCGB 2223]OCX53516.1 hypothetical protein BEL04_04240 [Mucilaginibacter sp. PPCGB 2223]
MKKIIIFIAVIAINLSAKAQMHMPGMQMDTAKKKPAQNAGTTPKKMDMDMSGMYMGDMSHAYSLNLPMNRDGSGTSWLPDQSPIYAYMLTAGKWNLMFHGAVFLRYTTQNFNNDGKRGQASKFDAPNWAMAMAQHKVGENGLFSASLMMSADALTEGGYGYPLLFQSGESWKNIPLVDRQHPHDLLAELAVAYTHAFNKDADLTAYAGYPGEPALGPVAFMHRPSAMNDPDATLAHHWQDATHITFGVATLGFRYKMAKIEASLFNGREPDENRYNFDKPVFNSYSYRLSVNPNEHLALQFSQGYIKGPEALNPLENILRTTASISKQYNFTDDKFLSSALIWGYNHVEEPDGHTANEHSVTAEGNIQLNKTAVYVRYEFVQKTSDELNLLPPDVNGAIFNVNAITLGINHRVLQAAGTNFTLGVQGTLNVIPQGLSTLYGSSPLGAEVYLKISPALMKTMKM